MPRAAQALVPLLGNLGWNSHQNPPHRVTLLGAKSQTRSQLFK
jgi:hypothetical protein